jgi:hypothetical protein
VFVELLEPDIEIQTARGIRHGVEDAAVWARQEYDHLVRRYSIDELHERGDLLLVLAHVQYVWRESGEVGDSSPVAILLTVREGKVSRWHVYETWDEGLEALGE